MNYDGNQEDIMKTLNKMRMKTSELNELDYKNKLINDFVLEHFKVMIRFL